MNIQDIKTFKGEIEQNKFYLILTEINLLKKEGYIFTRHIREDSGDFVKYDYELVLFKSAIIVSDNYKYASCNICLSKENLITFSGENNRLTITMCKNCIKELHTKTLFL